MRKRHIFPGSTHPGGITTRFGFGILNRPPEPITDRFLFRRHFLLGPRPSAVLKDWQVMSVGNGLTLHAHPDLTVTQVKHDDTELTLLGDLVDACHPERSNLEVLEALAPMVDESRAITRLTSECGGRWVLICDDKYSTTLMHDAGGLRQTFFNTDPHTGPWCSSRPERIAEVAGFDLNPDAQSGFLQTEYVSRHPEYYWPVDASPYAQVRRLLPNHFLNVREQTAHRYWPHESVPKLGLEEAVQRAAQVLRGLVAGAGRRFPMTPPITAGVDSRCLLAASRSIAPDLFCYTFQLPGARRRHPDVVVARRLLTCLGLRHHKVPCPRRMTGTFADMYRKNSAFTHERAGGAAQGLYKFHPPGFVCLTGHASEIARCGYYWRPENYPPVVSVETLLGYTYMDDTPFVRRHFEAWLEDARGIEERFGFPILDLFYWEQRVGSWAANIQSEWDIVHERFPPYSCRSLLETLLGTEPALRGSPGHALYVELMRHLWPDVLREPLNPPAPPPLKERLRPLLRATRTEALARRPYRALRSLSGA